MDYPVSMTPAEAAEACGVSERTIRGRIERGSLRTVKRQGRVYIARADLLSAGLLPETGSTGKTGKAPRGQENGQDMIGLGIVGLLAETQKALRESDQERGRLLGLLESADAKQTAERSASDAAQVEVVELRARALELEARLPEAMATDSASPEHDVVLTPAHARRHLGFPGVEPVARPVTMP